MRFDWLVFVMLLLLFLWNVGAAQRSEVRMAMIAVGALLLTFMLLWLLRVML